MGNGGPGGLGPSPVLLPPGVGACVLTPTKGQVWNPHPGPGTAPPAGLARPRLVSSAPPTSSGCQAIARIPRAVTPARNDDATTASGPCCPSQVSGEVRLDYAGSPRRRRGWALQGMGPSLAPHPPGTTLCPAFAARRAWETGSPTGGPVVQEAVWYSLRGLRL